MESNLSAKFEYIGAQEAQAILQNNRKNRPINKRNLSEIEAEIRRGNFTTTGETVKISKTGVLVDGQHRLLAIANVNPEKKLQMLVVRGVEDEAFKFIDTGRKRTASDVLSVQGIKNATGIAAMAKFIVNFKRGFYSSAADNHNKGLKKQTNKDVSDFVAKNIKELSDSFYYGHNKDNKIVNKATLASFHFITNEIDAVDADWFCGRLSDGMDLKSDSPIYQLRQVLLSDIRSTKKLNNIHKLALICKAWNLYRNDETVKSLKWDSIKEPFPKLK